MVGKLTEVLAAEVTLPTFADWLEAYRRSPARYDEELLGFWRESVRSRESKQGG